jgi:two-component system, LytTR family, response regulator
MTRFCVLVADDEPLGRSMVAALLREDNEVGTVYECADSSSARELIARHHPDIVFLDIEMPEITGLDLARDLTEDGPVVVFVTAFSRYAPEAFEVNASDYVLKPFSDRRFSEALQRAKRRVRERRLGDLANKLATLSSELRPDDQPPERKSDGTYLQRLSFRQGDRTIVVKAAELIWIEAEDYYVRIHSCRGRHLVRTALTTLDAQLDPLQFLRVHRGAIVNLKEVTEVRDAGGLTLVLTDGTEVPVSRSRRAAVESSLLPRRNTRGADGVVTKGYLP